MTVKQELPVRNAMTVDVEDYFQVEALSAAVAHEDWESFDLRVEKNTHLLLDLFENARVKATFFMLGWVAERVPALVGEIFRRGHEIACHGYSHKLIYDQSRTEFFQETERSKKLLEDLTGGQILGYRAASYSITNKSRWALEILAELGFEYDSSIVPVRHDIYGLPGAARHPHELLLSSGQKLKEFPPSTIRIFGINLPIAGGGYFRLYPYWFTRWAMNRVIGIDGQPLTFYIHPWELDPSQPRIRTNLWSHFRHYNNLQRSEPRLVRLLHDFDFGSMADILKRQSLRTVSFSTDYVGRDAFSNTPG